MKFDTDPSVRPADDLYVHVNGRWLATTDIPADKGRYGAFHLLRDASEVAVREVITDTAASQPRPGSDAARIADLYASFMDAEGVEASGLDWLGLERVDGIHSVDDLVAHLGWCLRSGVTSMFGAGVDSDPSSPDTYRLFLAQDGIGLPDEEYYRLERYAGVREAYRALVARLLELSGADPAAAASVVELETRIAALHWDKVRCRDFVATFNLTDAADLPAPWGDVLCAAGAGDLRALVVCQPSFFAEASGLLSDVDLATWRAWARFHLVKDRAFALPADVYRAWFDFYSTTLQGIPEQRERWKRGVSVVERYLGEAVGQLYVERHFGPEAKERMDALVANLLAAYGESIRSLEWMGDETRAEALAKLATFETKIGYPDRWKDYSALTIESHDLLGNVQRAEEFSFDTEVEKASGPVRRWEWLMTPQTVNAYYHPLRNEIVFPAAILQPPFFDPDASDAENYGAIGAVIGHEIGHGFDDQGSTCDGDGRLRDWWTPDDHAAFKRLTGRLVAQYDALAPAQLPDVHVNGSLTLGENIGDLGGLSIAYRAWQLAGGGTDDERRLFFLSWARIWGEKVRDAALAEQIATDPHSPTVFRCNQVVRNVDAFYDAFSVRPGDGLWLDPGDRVSIW